MRVLVTGASGRLGRAALPQLQAEGYDVRAMSRRPRPDSTGVEWVVADLATGMGIPAAVAGVDVILHLASAPYKGRDTRRVDVNGTRYLMVVADRVGVGHVLYPSIVGQDRIQWPYYRRKTEAEHLVTARKGGWSVIRITQFHELLDAGLNMLAKLPVLVTDPAIPVQPVDVREVAGRLLTRIADGPSGTIEEYGGPEVLTSADLIAQWQRARGRSRRTVNLRLPGRLGRAFRAGWLATDAQPRGHVTWGDYLQQTYG